MSQPRCSWFFVVFFEGNKIGKQVLKFQVSPLQIDINATILRLEWNFKRSLLFPLNFLVTSQLVKAWYSKEQMQLLRKRTHALLQVMWIMLKTSFACLYSQRCHNEPIIIQIGPCQFHKQQVFAGFSPFQVKLDLLLFLPPCSLSLLCYEKNESTHFQQWNVSLYELSSAVQCHSLAFCPKFFVSLLHQSRLSCIVLSILFLVSIFVFYLAQFPCFNFKLLPEYHPKIIIVWASSNY